MKAHTNPTRRAAHMLMAVATAFLLLLSIAPGADARGNEIKKGDTKILAATGGCPSGWVDGHNGCQPGSFTTLDVVYHDGSRCVFLDRWVSASVPGDCLPNTFGIDKGRQVYDSSGCVFLDKFVPASVPGDCLPNTFGIDRGGNVVAIVHHCLFSASDCEDFVLAAKAFGGNCVEAPGGGVYCEVSGTVPKNPRP